jgi:hypothetical protein
LIIGELEYTEPKATEYKRAAHDVPLEEKFIEVARYIAGKDAVKITAIETLLKRKKKHSTDQPPKP